MTTSIDREPLPRPANWASMAARLCFGATVVLIPFGLHLTLLARPSIPIYTDYTDFQLYATDVALLAMLAMWAISLAITPRRVRLGPRHIWMPLAGLTIVAWVSALSSYDHFLSVYHGIRLIALFWFYVYIVNEIPSLPWVIIPVGFQAVIQAIVGLGQFMAQRSLSLLAIGEQVLNPATPGVSVVTANGERLLRAYGLTAHPNILGGCLAFALVLLILPSLKSSARPAAYAAFIPASAALVTTFSRAAWLALAVGAAVILVVELTRHGGHALKGLLQLGLASALISISIIAAYLPFFGVRLGADRSFATATAEQQSLGQRFILVRDAMPMFLDRPLTGVGIGASPEAMQVYYPQFSLNYEPPHWALFDAALETGILGAAFYLALLLSPFISYIHRRESLFPRADATLALALLLSIIVVGFFDYYTWLLPAGRLWQWLAWGVWGMALERPTR